MLISGTEAGFAEMGLVPGWAAFSCRRSSRTGEVYFKTQHQPQAHAAQPLSQYTHFRWHKQEHAIDREKPTSYIRKHLGYLADSQSIDECSVAAGQSLQQS